MGPQKIIYRLNKRKDKYWQQKEYYYNKLRQ